MWSPATALRAMQVWPDAWIDQRVRRAVYWQIGSLPSSLTLSS